MKSLSTIIFILLVSLLHSQNTRISNAVKKLCIFSEKIVSSNQRSFNLHPDTISLFFRDVGSTEDEIQEIYVLEYENGKVSKTTFPSEFDYFIEIRHNYQGDKLIGGEILLISENSTEEYGYYTQSYDEKDRKNCVKIYLEGELSDGDSLKIEYDGNNIVHYGNYLYDEDKAAWYLDTEYADIDYNGDKIIAYNYRERMSSQNPVYQNSRFTEVEFVAGFQDYFFEPILNTFSYDSLDFLQILSPDNAGSDGYPSPAGFVREDLDEDSGLFVKVQQQFLEFDTDHYNVNIYDINNGNVKATDQIYLDSKARLERVEIDEGSFLFVKATRLFEYNEHERLGSGKEINDFGVTISSAEFDYNLDDQNNLIKYAERTYSVGFGEYAYGYIFGYKGTADSDVTDLDNKIKCNPNPFKNNFSLYFAQPAREGELIRIFDISGKEVSRVKLNSGTDDLQINMSGLASGSYILQYQSHVGMILEKLTKL